MNLVLTLVLAAKMSSSVLDIREFEQQLFERRTGGCQVTEKGWIINAKYRVKDGKITFSPRTGIYIFADFDARTLVTVKATDAVLKGQGCVVTTLW